VIILNKNSKLPAIFSLCDYSGNWPSEFEAKGYPVVLFDLKHGDNIIEKQHEVLTCGKFFDYKILGILASPVCTDFTVSGAQYWKSKDKDGRTNESLKLVDACLEIIEVLKPKWFAIENPVGRLSTLRPQIGPPRYYFNPCDFAGYLDENNIPENISFANEIRDKAELGLPLSKEMVEFSVFNNLYTKKTGIWGTSTIPQQKYIAPIRFKAKNGDYYSPVHWYSGGKSERTKTLRSMTPLGFAKAFYQANSLDISLKNDIVGAYE
jgi:hypothetical protein